MPHIIKEKMKKEKFAKLVRELGIHKTTIIFNINILKLCEKYRKLLKSSIGLAFFKNYHKNIKAICKPVTQFFITDIQTKMSLYAFISFEYVFLLVCTNF